MGLKLVFFVLLSLILLVANATEARKMVEGNSESLFISEYNHQQALKEIYGSGYPFQEAEDNHQHEISGFGNPWKRFKYNEGAEDNHQHEISGFGNPWKRFKYNVGAEDNHQEEIFGFGDMFRSWHKQGAEDNHQQEISNSENWLLHKQKGNEDNDEQVKKENEHIHSSFFFLMDDLKIGKTKTISFQKRKKLISSPSNSRYFFPKEAADSIPFSSKELPNVLQRFSLSKNSPQAKSMEDTLRVCEDSPIKGETKYCATSAEAMLNYVQGIMGGKTQVEALSTKTYFSKDLIRPQNYTILAAPQEVAAPKMVACHVLPYAHTAILYCHNTVSKVKLFKVSLGYAATGDIMVEAIAVCHLDTSEWNPSHESLLTLGILPGTSPVCHFFTSSNDLVWLPKPILPVEEL
ncbi:putative LRR receptor-like serine/threonine-protein kinase EFR-like [Capsicum annuum]|uniref:BURP domain-containing protein BNM2A n=1 Tax=Capsicum annuum TaxID=4072 RepID=UPI001FB08932|nr:BURP domain-containing protein BNM2A [Capsicum annuum]KAF3615905.1 putative LRR receptor-like serine/threonine-protein kinase EFR-like [Capsicum annuum]KAF3684636.1 putative LRR receptor-like serine/threonine-protein kinase EFR-like [Capsicum annuum]